MHKRVLQMVARKVRVDEERHLLGEDLPAERRRKRKLCQRTETAH